MSLLKRLEQGQRPVDQPSVAKLQEMRVRRQAPLPGVREGPGDLKTRIQNRLIAELDPSMDVTQTVEVRSTIEEMFEAILARGEEPGLLIDLGTNTEVAVGWGGWVVVASAPAGPAFEGEHIEYGMKAVEGAIERVRITGSAVECLLAPRFINRGGCFVLPPCRDALRLFECARRLDAFACKVSGSG